MSKIMVKKKIVKWVVKIMELGEIEKALNSMNSPYLQTAVYLGDDKAFVVLGYYK